MRSGLGYCDRGIGRKLGMSFSFECEQEGGDRRIAELLELPGVLAYGISSADAMPRAEVLAFVLSLIGMKMANPSQKVWRLVEIRSMDDAHGSQRPRDPSRYMLRFDRSGQASLQLDCNRATGSFASRVPIVVSDRQHKGSQDPWSS